ncbi:hypothetical protein [Salinarimonas sp.]|uniref:hypothetical protein n=1 Tax=Salinarimonas sp. TaxID=2766526 RepID=UPI003919CC11
MVVSRPESPGASCDTRRAELYAAFLSRRDGGPIVEAADGDCADLCERLLARGLTFREKSENGGETLRFVPGIAVASAFARGEAASAWPSALAKKLGKSVRRTPGALFRFPSEVPGGVAIVVFITDWSPCPAACAVAVHPGHEAAAGVAEGFTGCFVRHPLTGDLLPVFVADWVKPSFGTGAVLVNPAHDRVDLAYARKIGLPVRFALAPEGYEAEPEQWLMPPVVKTGRASRTGSFDGLDVAAATRAYYETLERRGLAERHEDVRLPPTDLASAGPDGARVFSDAVRTAAALARASASAASPPVLVASAACMRETAPALAPLLAELEIAIRVVVLGPVEGTALLTDAAAEQEIVDLSLAVAARPSEPAVIRRDHFDQARRFRENHERLAAALRASGPERADAPADLPRPISTAIMSGDVSAGFKALYALQKGLVGGSGLDAADAAELAAYERAASVLTGAQLG